LASTHEAFRSFADAAGKRDDKVLSCRRWCAAVNNCLAGNRGEHHNVEGNDADDRHTEFHLRLLDAKSTSAMHGDELHLSTSAFIASVPSGASKRSAMDAALR
jgi:hypothetical protein